MTDAEAAKLKAEEQALADEAAGKVDSPIVLELFTASDCSACIFADRILYDAMKDKNVIKPPLLTTNEESGFKIQFYDTVTINDTAIKPTTVYPFDKWHVAVLKVGANEANAFDKIRIGTNQHGNTARHITIGDGFEILKGNSSKVSEKVDALMTAYNIQK